MLALLAFTLLNAQFEESITVTRVLVDVRIISTAGKMAPDLTAEDFEVRLGGKKAIVEAAEWVGSGARNDAEPIPMLTDDGRLLELPPPQGRLMVMLVQTDFARNSWRVEGQMKFLQYVNAILAPLQPGDRMAVFSFDSRLKFRLDFSSDKDQIRAAIEQSIFIDDPSPAGAVPYPSIAGRLSDQAMRRAATTEAALRIIGEALRNIPGAKTLILLGHGLGQKTPGGVTMTRAWPEARRALNASRVALMALDTTYADQHDLEKGLMAAAAETGGFYVRTHKLPLVAIAELHSVLNGHYELSVRGIGSLKPGMRSLDVRVKRPGMRAVAPQSVLITP